MIVFGATGTTGYQAATGERIWWATGLAVGPASSPSVVADTLFASEPAGTDLATPFSVFLGMDKNKDGKVERAEVKDAGMLRLVMGVDETNGNKDGFLEESEWLAFEAAGKSRGGLVALQLGGRGDVTATAVRWKMLKSVPYLTSSLVYDRVVYLIRDGQRATLIDFGAGKILDYLPGLGITEVTGILQQGRGLQWLDGEVGGTIALAKPPAQAEPEAAPVRVMAAPPPE